MPVELALLVFLLLGLGLWLSVMFRRRSAAPRVAEADTSPPQRRQTAGIVWVALVLFLLWLAIDVLSISVLGTNARNTFSYVPPQRSGPTPPPGKAE